MSITIDTPRDTGIVVDKTLWVDGDQYESNDTVRGGIRTRQTDVYGRVSWVTDNQCHWSGDPELNSQGAVGMPNADGSPSDLIAVRVGGKPWSEWAQLIDAQATAATVNLTKPDMENEAKIREYISELQESVAALRQEIADRTREVEGLNERITYVNERNANLSLVVSQWESDAEKVAEALREEAIRRDWCSDYGDFVERVNRRTARFELLSCSRDYVVSFTVDVHVNARTPDEAQEMAEGEVNSAIRSFEYSAHYSCDDVNTDN